ncbi:unnamed protein product [Paramecium sonneborni]|uniref:Protein YIPF n=1 Tax=Paramecium sonneborni TaxID=65129 RepID=A0A8S1REF9_9CILI|nr:unnamed protein product [Paramecium sonneborni]
MDFFQEEEEEHPEQKGCCAFLTIRYYQPYFNVSEDDVIDRIKASFLPFKRDFHERVAGNPDLWGPLWISATIIFLITAVANINQMNLEGQTKYSVAYVPQSAALLYCISFGTPIIITIVMKILGSDIRFFHTLCLYGYSMSILMPITILCVIRYYILQWCLVSYGMISSSIFLIMGMRRILGDLEQAKRYIIVGIILAMQFSLYLIYKLVFFKVIEKNSAE